MNSDSALSNQPKLPKNEIIPDLAHAKILLAILKDKDVEVRRKNFAEDRGMIRFGSASLLAENPNMAPDEIYKKAVNKANKKSWEAAIKDRDFEFEPLFDYEIDLEKLLGIINDIYPRGRNFLCMCLTGEKLSTIAETIGIPLNEVGSFFTFIINVVFQEVEHITKYPSQYPAHDPMKLGAPVRRELRKIDSRAETTEYFRDFLSNLLTQGYITPELFDKLLYFFSYESIVALEKRTIVKGGDFLEGSNVVLTQQESTALYQAFVDTISDNNYQYFYNFIAKAAKYFHISYDFNNSKTQYELYEVLNRVLSATSIKIASRFPDFYNLERTKEANRFTEFIRISTVIREA